MALLNVFFFICRVLSQANREPQKPIDDEPVGRVHGAADGLMDRWKSLQWTQTPLQQLASLLKEITTRAIHPMSATSLVPTLKPELGGEKLGGGAADAK